MTMRATSGAKNNRYTNKKKELDRYREREFESIRERESFRCLMKARKKGLGCRRIKLTNCYSNRTISDRANEMTMNDDMTSTTLPRYNTMTTTYITALTKQLLPLVLLLDRKTHVFLPIYFFSEKKACVLKIAHIN
jgi:hypothetical protein